MSANTGLENCFSFINSQLRPGAKASGADETAPRWFVTLSREAGCGGHATGARLAELLQARSPAGQAPWTLFDRNLVEQVLEDHHLPKRFEKFMPEDRVTEIADIMDELFDLHPSSWTLVHKTSETMLRLAELGHCILIGRGASIVTGKLEHGFHVRLIGSRERRVERMMHFEKLSRDAAQERVDKEGRARDRYVTKYFRKDVNDLLAFHLVINTDHFSTGQTAQIIAEALLGCMRKEPPERAAADRTAEGGGK